MTVTILGILYVKIIYDKNFLGSIQNKCIIIHCLYISTVFNFRKTVKMFNMYLYSSIGNRFEAILTAHSNALEMDIRNDKIQIKHYSIISKG